jgi:hypothetical protein
MAPAILKALQPLLENAIRKTSSVADADVASLGPLEASAELLKRDILRRTDSRDIGSGSISPTSFNNNAIFALFGLIGAAFVIVGIWFFFWAKNGGFEFKEDDWEDYKSTVLRRKGPNGTILSGATPTTQLGGGSIYKDINDGSTEADDRTVISGTTTLSGITAGASDIAGREKRRKKREQREREKDRRREKRDREKKEGKGSRKVGPDGALIDEEAEQEAMDHLRQYRHEKPARVGGINKQSEGSAWDGSTNPTHSTASASGAGDSTIDGGSTVTSELISYRERTPTTTPTKRESTTRSLTNSPTKREKALQAPAAPPATAVSGIRKVYSTADKNASRESERIRAEARKLAEKGRAAQRRDFSWQRADDATTPLRSIYERSEVSSSSRNDEASSRWTGSEPTTESDLGTKVYQHSVHVPGTASNELGYIEEKRKKRGGAGYRRNRDEV